MDLHGPLFGYGDQRDHRAQVFRALVCATTAIVQLDTETRNHPLRSPWVRIEQQVAMAGAARAARLSADPTSIFAARLGAMRLDREHVQLGQLDDRARRWGLVAQRKGPAELRALVSRLAPDRGSRDPVALAEQVSNALPACVQSWFGVATSSGPRKRTFQFEAAPAGSTDISDLALALPYALRRVGLTSGVVPTLIGSPRAFLREDQNGLAALQTWAETLSRQAGEGAARLRALESYVAAADRQLASVRRPAALSRLVATALNSWTVWAAGLARRTDVDISSAWRLLGQAVELGLVLEVPCESASRGNGTMYAAPPILRLAGLMSVRRGRPAATVVRGDDGAGLGDAIAELEAAMAATDRLNGRV